MNGGGWAKYTKHYKKEWEDLPSFKAWLSGEGDAAYCKLCKADLRPQLADLKRHERGKKHMSLMRAISFQKSVATNAKSIEDQPVLKKRRLEIRLALHTAVSTSFRSMDTLGAILEEEFGRSSCQMRRTKCSQLVKKVLSPHFQADLQEDIMDTPFSLLTDETTDIAINKILGISIKYFSKKMKRIVSTFLGILEVKAADAISLEAAIRTLMEKWRLQGENMIGIGTDGASVMCGEKHSVVSLLKKKWPHIIHIRCTCHSMDLIAKNAVKATLPSHIDFLVRESHNWFCHSSSRLQAYQEVAKLVGFTKSFTAEDDQEDDEVLSKPPPRLISPSDTRWLVHADCIERILSQYHALKAHFQIAYTREKCFQAKTLFEMFNDTRNYLYLLFVLPFLAELKRLTKIFQSNSIDILKVCGELETAFCTLARKILKPSILYGHTTLQLMRLRLDSDFCFLEADSADLGSTFLQKLEASSLSEEEKMELKARGKAFLKEVLIGFQKRFCAILESMSAISNFSNDAFKNCTFSAEKFPPPFFPQDHLSISRVEQAAKLLQSCKTDAIHAESTESFWISVHNYLDVANSKPFYELSCGVIQILCLPISNAEIERVFSQVSLLRNARRSAMTSELLEAILYVKFGLSRLGKTASSFKPTTQLLKFDSSMYD